MEDCQVSVLSIQLLGDFHLRYGDKPVTAVKQPRQQALLAYLLLHRHAAQSRQHLAFLFWPDASETQAQTNLRNLLYKLRHALPEADRFLYTGTQTVQWQPDAPYTCDLVDFETAHVQAVTRDDLEQAVKLYPGDLMPSCYDDWIRPERERLRHLALSGLARLIDLLEAERDYPAAIGYGQRLLQLNPIDEAMVRTLMRLYALNGNRAGALRVYLDCVATFQAELAAEPATATAEVYRRLVAAEVAAPSHTPLTQNQLPLVDRQAEWQMLQGLWFAAVNGKPSATSSSKPQCIVLSGEAGIGKTRLAEELLVWVTRQGFATAIARCYAAEGALPFAPAVAWLRSAAVAHWLLDLEPVWLSEVARLLPELLDQQPFLPRPGPLTEVWQRQHLFEGLARALCHRHEPLLLFLDDLQLADRDTLEWLHFLLRFDRQARLLLVVTLRTDDVATSDALNALLSALQRDGQVVEVELNSLNASETAAVAAAVSGQTISPEETIWLYQETEGNPLFIVETVRSWLSRDGTWEIESSSRQSPISDPRSLPARVHTVMHTRLSQLSPKAHELAGVAAAVGREFTFTVLNRASGQDDDMLVHSLDELCLRRIVRERGGEIYDFTHDKLREVAYNSLSAARRRLLHRRIAQALEKVHGQALDTVSGQVATHYELAGLLEQAIPHYQRAGEVAERIYAHTDAIHYFRRALALLRGLAGQTQVALALEERLGDIWHLTGEYEKARDVYREAVKQHSAADPITQARLLRKASNTWREQYCYPQAMQVYLEAEGVLGEFPDPADAPHSESRQPGQAWWQEWIQILLEINSLYYWQHQVEESVALCQKLRPVVEQHGTPVQQASFFQHVAWRELQRNRYVATDEIVAWSQTALAALQGAGSQTATAIPSAQFGAGYALLWRGQPEAALKHMEIALQLAEQTGDINLQARCLAYITIAHRQCSRLAEAQQYALRCLAVATQAHMPEYAGMAEANLAWVGWCAGDVRGVETHGQAALTYWQQLPTSHPSLPFQWTVHWPLLALSLGEDDLAAAMEHGRRLLDPFQQRVPDALQTLLEQAAQAWEHSQPEATRVRLQQGLALAQQMHYL
ncbi:MAG: hypothetical protein EXR62_05380 [Chloroflexi bacterium]|nr:hypothetical protein [Chloroflexota bacterium]